MNEREWREQLADKARIAALEATLRFYADDSNYEHRWADDGDDRWDEMSSPIEGDGGQRARMVLNLTEPESKPTPKPTRFYYSPPKPCPTGDHRYHRSERGLWECERRAKRLAQEVVEREAKIRWLRFDDGVAALKATGDG